MLSAAAISVDPHKWLFQPYEAGCILVRDLGTLERAFSIQHDVLQDSVWGTKHANLADYGIQLSRSFRPLKIWMSIQTFGMAAFRAAIENGLDLASMNREVLARMFWGEQAFLSSTMVNKRFVLRLCIVNHNTTWDDVRATLEAVERSLPR